MMRALFSHDSETPTYLSVQTHEVCSLSEALLGKELTYTLYP